MYKPVSSYLYLLYLTNLNIFCPIRTDVILYFHAIFVKESLFINLIKKIEIEISLILSLLLQYTSVIKNNINHFLNTNKYSCAISKKLYLILFVFQYPVALQLCCSFIISSFNLKPEFSNIRITSNDIGIIQPF